MNYQAFVFKTEETVSMGMDNDSGATVILSSGNLMVKIPAGRMAEYLLNIINQEINGETYGTQ